MADLNARAKWPWRAALMTLAASAAVLAAGPLMVAGLDYRPGLAMFALGAIVAGAGAVVLIVALLLNRGSQLLLGPALVAGLVAALVPLSIVFTSGKAPQIHDISTDTADPPSFVALVPLRGEGASPAGYDGPEAAAAQRVGYPNLAGVLLAGAPRAAYDRALAAARAMNWQIVSADPASGRIEAIATVPWWGFKDDVVVRVRPDGNGSRVDVRSKSRVGKGDLGVNAARIEAYLAKLR